MAVLDEPELSLTICAAVLNLAHKTLPLLGLALERASEALVASASEQDLLPELNICSSEPCGLCCRRLKDEQRDLFSPEF